MRTWLRSPFTRRAYEHFEGSGGDCAHVWSCPGRQPSHVPRSRPPAWRSRRPRAYPTRAPSHPARQPPTAAHAARQASHRAPPVGSDPAAGAALRQPAGARPKGAPASRRAASWAPRPRPRSARPGRAPSAAPCTARPRRCSSRCARCGRGHQAVSAAGACLCGACPRGHYCLCVQTGSSGGLRRGTAGRQADGRPRARRSTRRLAQRLLKGRGWSWGGRGRCLQSRELLATVGASRPVATSVMMSSCATALCRLASAASSVAENSQRSSRPSSLPLTRNRLSAQRRSVH